MDKYRIKYKGGDTYTVTKEYEVCVLNMKRSDISHIATKNGYTVTMYFDNYAVICEQDETHTKPQWYFEKYDKKVPVKLAKLIEQTFKRDMELFRAELEKAKKKYYLLQNGGYPINAELNIRKIYKKFLLS